MNDKYFKRTLQDVKKALFDVKQEDGGNFYNSVTEQCIKKEITVYNTQSQHEHVISQYTLLGKVSK